eukprot:1158373-Pelagomonas_calceolata.AAC.2
MGTTDSCPGARSVWGGARSEVWVGGRHSIHKGWTREINRNQVAEGQIQWIGKTQWLVRYRVPAICFEENPAQALKGMLVYGGYKIILLGVNIGLRVELWAMAWSDFGKESEKEPVHHL